MSRTAAFLGDLLFALCLGALVWLAIVIADAVGCGARPVP